MSILIIPVGDSTDFQSLPDTLEFHKLKDQKSYYGDAVAPRTDKHGGYFAIDGKVVAQTIQCCHCPAHFVARKGSGAVRHYCPRCNRVTCGNYFCQPSFCMTWSQKLDLIERAEMRRRSIESYFGG
jgi:hypothetical protein